MFEITKEFRFEAAHTLHRDIAVEASRRIHGHSYRAEVTLRGTPDAHGMVLDFGMLGDRLAVIRTVLDHRLLDDIDGLGPATLENLARYIWAALAPHCPGLTEVAMFRDSEGESCRYRGPDSRR